MATHELHFGATGMVPVFRSFVDGSRPILDLVSDYCVQNLYQVDVTSILQLGPEHVQVLLTYSDGTSYAYTARRIALASEIPCQPCTSQVA